MIHWQLGWGVLTVLNNVSVQSFECMWFFYFIFFPVLAALEREGSKLGLCSLMVPQQLRWHVRTAPGKVCEHQYGARAERDAPGAVGPMRAAAGGSLLLDFPHYIPSNMLLPRFLCYQTLLGAGLTP